MRNNFFKNTLSCVYKSWSHARLVNYLTMFPKKLLTVRPKAQIRKKKRRKKTLVKIFASTQTQKYKNEHRFNGVYLRNILPKIQDKKYVINLEQQKSIGIHWVALYVIDKNVTYSASFGIYYIPIEIQNQLEYHNKY